MKTVFILIAAFIGLPIFTIAQTKEELRKKYKEGDLNQAIDKILKTKNSYPDNIILPPLHYTNTYYKLKNGIDDFTSISIDVEVDNNVPNGYYFYISPLNLCFNGIFAYCGILSKDDGINSKTNKEENISFSGIFSRWYEREKGALKTNGYYCISASEGDFISVKNPVGWNKGTYRITIKKDGYVPGKSLPEKINPEDIYFTWGEYEHTWLTMTVEDLNAHKITTVGSMAFPGKKIKLDENIASFIEQYRCKIDFADKPRFSGDSNYIYYKDIPYIRVILKNLMINGNPTKLEQEQVQTFHNRTHHPDQDSIKGNMPILSTDRFDPKENKLILETGILNQNRK